MLVDADAWRPRILAAVRRTTGRELRIGHLRLVPALTPTLSITDVSLANIPGGSQPEMLRVPRVQVKLSLLPLLAGRIEIARLVLERPAILLERDAQGAPNWRLGEALTMAASPNAAEPNTAESPGTMVRELVIDSGTVRWRRAGGERHLEIQRLTASAYGLESPVTIEGRATYAGLNLALEAECGPLSRLVDRSGIAPWPLKGTLETPGARLVFAGTLRQPLEGTGYTLTLEGATVNLPVLDALLGRSLPPLRQVAVAARLVDSSGSGPEISGIALRIGAADLDFLHPGLSLSRAEFSAASLADKLRGEMDISLGGVPVHLTAALGSLGALLSAEGIAEGTDATALSVELAAEAAGATLAVNGTMPLPLTAGGLDLAITGRVPDLSALSPLAGMTLPALHPLMIDGRLAGLAASPNAPIGAPLAGVAVRGLALTTPEADLSGELTVSFVRHPVVQGNLASRRLDLDAIDAALAPPVDTAPPPSTGTHLFSPVPLPWAVMSRADLDLRLSVGELRLGGASWRDVAGHAVMQAGRLTIDPLTASLPSGRAVGHFGLDAAATPPQVGLGLRASGVGLRPLAALLGLPGDVTGTGDLDLDLHAAGRSPRILAATLAGRLSLTASDAGLDNRLLSLALPALMPQALPQAAAEVQALARPGRAPLRCLVLRAEAEAGTITLPLLALEAGHLTLQGAGTASLREETMQLHLRPVLRASPVPVVPMRLAGPLAAPHLGPEPRGASLPALLPGSERGDVCTPALAAQRAAARATAGGLR